MRIGGAKVYSKCKGLMPRQIVRPFRTDDALGREIFVLIRQGYGYVIKTVLQSIISGSYSLLRLQRSATLQYVLLIQPVSVSVLIERQRQMVVLKHSQCSVYQLHII